MCIQFWVSFSSPRAQVIILLIIPDRKYTVAKVWWGWQGHWTTSGCITRRIVSRKRKEDTTLHSLVDTWNNMFHPWKHSLKETQANRATFRRVWPWKEVHLNNVLCRKTERLRLFGLEKSWSFWCHVGVGVCGQEKGHSGYLQTL